MYNFTKRELQNMDTIEQSWSGDELKIEEESLDEEWAEPPAFGGCSTRGQSKPGEEQPLHFMKRAKELEGVQP